MSAQLPSRFSVAERLAIFVATLVVAAAWWLTPTEITGLLTNTLKLAFAVLIVSLPLAGLLAYSTARCSVPAKGLWDGCMLVLLFLPLYMQLASWEAGFGRRGWYSNMMGAELSNPTLEGFRGAVWVHAMAAVPWLFWIFRLGFAAVPRTFEEMAALDARPWQVFRRVTLPFMLPVFLAGAFYVLIVASTEITVTDRYQFRSYAEVLYNDYVLNSRLDALPLSVGPVLALMVAVAVLGLAMCKLVWPKLLHPTVDRERQPLGSTNWLATSFVVGMVAMLLVLPVGNLFYQAGVDVQADPESGSPARLWTIGKFSDTLGSSPLRYKDELAWTAILSQLSMVGAVCFATVAAWFARRSFVLQSVNTLVAILCFVTPGPLIGFGIIAALNRRSPEILGWLYDDTLFAPWLAIVIRCFPFAYLIVWYGLRSIPRTIFESAETDGASSLACFWRVALPLLKPSLICSAVVCLAVSVGELSASVLVMPPGVTTVATKILSMIHYGADDQLAGLCLCCLGVFVTLSLIAKLTVSGLTSSRTIG